MSISLNTVNSEVVRAHKRIDDFITCHTYQGDGRSERVLDLGIAINKKIKFAILISETYASNNPYSYLNNSVHIHNLIIRGYRLMCQSNNRICQFMENNTLKVWYNNDNDKHYEGLSRINHMDGVFHVIIFYDI